MAEKTFFISGSFNDLKDEIRSIFKEEFNNFHSSKELSKEEIEHITRKETAKILHISLPTLNNWTKQGLVNGYRIGSRVLYKKSEIFEALKKIQTMKFGRSI